MAVKVTSVLHAGGFQIEHQRAFRNWSKDNIRFAWQDLAVLVRKPLSSVTMINLSIAR